MRDHLRTQPKGIDSAFPVTKNKSAPGHTRFYVPPTLRSDFENWLMTDVPNTNYTFEVVRDWYQREEPAYQPEFIRASFFPIQWKSKIGNSDVNSNFKTHHRVDIKKGDIVVREDGEIMMLNWAVQKYPNNQTTQAITCNAQLTFMRQMPEKLDARGYLLEEARDEIVAPQIPCVYAEYAGRPDYAPNYNAPGIQADHLITLQVQFNPLTKKIRVHDTFELLNNQYRLADLIGSEVDIDRQFGILNLMARKMAGEDSDEWRV